MCLILGVAQVSIAAAEPPSLYQQYLSDGKKAFDKGADAEASRYFLLASNLEPSAEEPYQYLERLNKRSSVPDTTPAQSRQPDNIDEPGYQELLNLGQDAFEQGDTARALEFFYKAHMTDPDLPEALEYINLIYRLRADRVSPAIYWKTVNTALDQFDQRGSSIAKPVKPAPETISAKPVTSMALPEKALPEKSKPTLVRKTKIVTEEASLEDILRSGEGRATIMVPMTTMFIIKGKNIDKHLVIDPGVIEVNILDRDRIEIIPERRGTTFLHIWDERGRSTIYIEVLLPPPGPDEVGSQADQQEHARPFVLSYSADRSAYYIGDSTNHLKRQSVAVQQNLGIDGETPYGILDASGTMGDHFTLRNVPNYTVGLSNIPLKGANHFNVRAFDASRSLSPLTLPGTQLRGVFVDADLFKDMVALSLSHGKRQPSFGYFSFSNSSSRDVYVDGVRVVLFPKSMDNRYAFNFAHGYGSDRDAFLTDRVYSVESHHKLNKVSLDTELARDRENTANSAQLQWKGEGVRTGLSFRDINKDFTTVTSYPANQGEIGATWSTDMSNSKMSAESMVDAYRDRIYFNPNDPQAFNYETSAHTKITVDEKHWVDTNVRYVDTPGELSPRRYASGDTRLSRRFDLWNGRKGTIFAGGGYQRSRYANAPISEYDRSSATTGVQVPLTQHVSGFANYEYSWVHEPFSGMSYSPNVLNTGLSYQKAFTDKLSGNLGATYRDEQNVVGVSSFLAGEDSVALSSGLSYHPAQDVTFYLDSRWRDVWSEKTGNPSYNDLDVRFGIRAKWGSPVRWDPSGTITGIIFKDINGNGKIDAGEEGISGVRVKAGEKEAVTDLSGAYRLDVRAKRVTVTPLLENLPPGFVFSTQGLAKVDIVQGRTYRANFGLTSRSGIYGVVFVDKNGNGIPDRDDKFIRQVKMVLDGKEIQTSDTRGAYFFKNVTEGKHTIELDMASVPIDFIPLVKLKNEISVAEGTTYFFHVPMRTKEAGGKEQ